MGEADRTAGRVRAYDQVGEVFEHVRTGEGGEIRCLEFPARFPVLDRSQHGTRATEGPTWVRQAMYRLARAIRLLSRKAERHPPRLPAHQKPRSSGRTSKTTVTERGFHRYSYCPP